VIPNPESQSPGVDGSEGQAVLPTRFSDRHDELLARQAVFAISIGRLMDGVELSALGLRLRLAHAIGADAKTDDPRLLVVSRRVLVRGTYCLAGW